MVKVSKNDKVIFDGTPKRSSRRTVLETLDTA